MIVSDDLPADWALTICNLFSVHYILLKEQKKVNTNMLLNFVFENYTFTLLKVKQATFSVNLFASLSYDLWPKMKNIMKLGTNVLNLQDNDKTFGAEYWIYLGFTSAILADLEKQSTRQSTQELESIKMFNKELIIDARLENLFEFILQYIAILETKSTKFNFHKLSPNDFGWKKAICRGRQHPRLCRPSLLKTWLTRLGEI